MNSATETAMVRKADLQQMNQRVRGAGTLCSFVAAALEHLNKTQLVVRAMLDHSTMKTNFRLYMIGFPYQA